MFQKTLVFPKLWNILFDFCPALTKLALDLHVKKCLCVCVYCVRVVSVFPVFSVTNFLGLIGDALGEVNWRSPRRRGRAQLATPSANSAKLIGEALGEGVELEG